MAAEEVHMAEAPRDAAVRHRDRHLVQRFQHQCPEIPVSVGAAHPGARVALDRVVEIGKAQRIAVEEDRRIVADQVPVAFLGVELQCSAADVTLGIGGTPFAGDHRERANMGVCLPISEKIFAFVKRVMSYITVKVPWAPQPFACIRRSGITSRSKCASFSISQISCNSAGPRGPAVMMLVLSATGAPLALVKRFVVDMRNSLGCIDAGYSGCA